VKYQEESSAITKKSDYPSSVLDSQSSPSSNTKIVKFIEQEVTPKSIIPEGFTSTESFIERISKKIPDGVAKLQEARNKIAQTHYAEHASFSSLRLRAGMSQRELSKKVGTSQAHISKIEQGINDPSLSTLRKLSKALNVSIDELSEAIELK
jgi:ribosome-binding protein aMBF1 (putative translation factor)